MHGEVAYVLDSLAIMYQSDSRIVALDEDKGINFQPLTVDPKMRLSEAIAYIHSSSHPESGQPWDSFVLVTQNRRLLGVLHLYDLLGSSILSPTDGEPHVEDLMHPIEVTLTIPEGKTISEVCSPSAAMALLRERQLQYLPAIDSDGCLIGVVTPATLIHGWQNPSPTEADDSELSLSPNTNALLPPERPSHPQQTNFDRTFAQAAIGMAHIDLQGNFIEVNQQFCELIGYSHAELIHRSFFELMVPQKLQLQNNYDYAKVTERYLDRLLSGKLPFITIENIYINQAGTQIWVNITVSLVRTDAGEPDYFVSAIEDISDRKLLEQKLHSSEAELRSVFAAMTQIVLAIDAEAEVIKVSPTCPALTYNNEVDLIGEIINQIIYGPYRPTLLSHLNEVITTQNSINFEYQLAIEDRVFWFTATLSPMSSRRAILVALDITGRKEQEEQLRLLQRSVEISDNGIIISDAQVPNLPILYVNPAFERITGYSAKESINRRFLFVYEDFIDLQTFSEINHAIREGKYYQFCVQSDRKDSTTFHSELSLYPLRDLCGTLTHYVGLQLDITERVAAEEALKKSEERWQLALQSNNDGIYDWNLESDTIFYSARWKQMLGFSESEISDRPSEWMTRLHPDDFENVMFANVRYLGDKHQPLFTSEYRMRCKDGTYKWILDRGQILYNRKGEEVRIIGSYTDITNRKQSEEKLRESQQRLEFLVDRTPLGVIEWSIDWTIIEWNKAAEAIFGYRRPEVLSSPHSFELLFSPEHNDRVQDFISSLESEDDTTYLVCDNITRDRQSIICEWYNTILMDRQGNIIGYASMIADISDRKQAELALIQAKEAAESANQAKSQFLANMSHELRTPLNAILGFTQLIDRSPNLDPVHRNQLQIINRSGEHLLSLINDILEMSKIEAGRITLNPSIFNLWILLETLQEMLSIKAEGKGLTLQAVRSPQVPECIYGDESKLRQVLLNLLGNAIKFTEQGEVRLFVSAIPALNETLPYEVPAGNGLSPSPLRLRFTIADTGPGIEEDDLNTLFEPFVQTAIGRKSQQGTGLGLPISRQFVKLMGGDIQVFSRVGVGTQFTFDVLLEEAIERNPNIGISSRITHLAPDQPSYRVLVVDDALENRLLLESLLKTVGFEVAVAGNGEEAIAIWEHWHPHLIWMDIRMPVMDGLQATRHIKSHPQGKSTPIIALTASAFEEERQQILQVGCDDFMSKPFQDRELLEKIAKHLGVSYSFGYPDEVTRFLVHPSSFSPNELDVSLNWNIMPKEWLRSVYQAAIEADGELILELLDRVPPQEKKIINYLSECANNFEFEVITECLSSMLI